MWDLPGPGLKPVSPALASGFLNTAPPGKPLVFFKRKEHMHLYGDVGYLKGIEKELGGYMTNTVKF